MIFQASVVFEVLAVLLEIQVPWCSQNLDVGTRFCGRPWFSVVYFHDYFHLNSQMFCVWDLASVVPCGLQFTLPFSICFILDFSLALGFAFSCGVFLPLALLPFYSKTFLSAARLSSGQLQECFGGISVTIVFICWLGITRLTNMFF